jgi:hypothetical protein
MSASFPLTKRLGNLTVFAKLRRLAKQEGVTYLPCLIAEKIGWSLLLCAEPNCERFAREVPRVMTGHGMVSFKRYEGYLYPYLPCYLMSPDRGRYLVDSFLESSEFTYEQVVQQEPRFADVIDVVGSLAADDLLEKNIRRDEIRRQLGFDPADFVILIQSTFHESLIEDLGFGLLDECKRLAELKGYKFVISLHPHLWSGPYSEEHPWGERALGYASDSILIRRPEEDGDLGMIASDMVVTDHTSLCSNYALLDKPMLIYLPKNGSQATDVLEPLLALYPLLDEATGLDVGIDEAQRVHRPEKLREVMNRFVSCRGQAAEKINQVFDRLLA